MLPTDAFAEAVAFLPIFDLSALVVTNAMCSSMAVHASARIRWEEFPGLRISIVNGGPPKFVGVDALMNGHGPYPEVATPFFPNESANGRIRPFRLS